MRWDILRPVFYREIRRTRWYERRKGHRHSLTSIEIRPSDSWFSQERACGKCELSAASCGRLSRALLSAQITQIAAVGGYLQWNGEPEEQQGGAAEVREQPTEHQGSVLLEDEQHGSMRSRDCFEQVELDDTLQLTGLEWAKATVNSDYSHESASPSGRRVDGSINSTESYWCTKTLVPVTESTEAQELEEAIRALQVDVKVSRDLAEGSDWELHDAMVSARVGRTLNGVTECDRSEDKSLF